MSLVFIVSPSEFSLIIFVQLNMIYAAYNHQARFGFYSFLEPQRSMVEKTNTGLTDPQFPASVSSKLFTLFYSIYFNHRSYQ
jgi:hypothetical protein